MPSIIAVRFDSFAEARPPPAACRFRASPNKTPAISMSTLQGSTGKIRSVATMASRGTKIGNRSARRRTDQHGERRLREIQVGAQARDGRRNPRAGLPSVRNAGVMFAVMFAAHARRKNDERLRTPLHTGEAEDVERADRDQSRRS